VEKISKEEIESKIKELEDLKKRLLNGEKLREDPLEDQESEKVWE
jgi:hypothetical protein